MPTSISDLWVPDVWVEEVAEKMNTLPALISSPIVKRSTEFDALASDKGQAINMPYFRDITDQADTVQVENQQPARQVIGSGKQIATILNRETANDATALAKQVSGTQPVEEITAQIAMRKQKQRQTTLVSLLRGAFDFASAPGANTGALKGVRYDAFAEAGANPDDSRLIDPVKFINACAFLGEIEDQLLGGGILMHPLIRAALLAQDQISFEHLSKQEGIRLETYKGLRVFQSNKLKRAGTGGGLVFDTYVFAPGTVGWGEKPQQGQTIDVASLSYWADVQKNNEEIYDRSRFLLHLNGMRWVGTPAGQSATNTELETAANWNLDYTTPDRVGIVCIRTNG
jgi:hypothetical protein